MCPCTALNLTNIYCCLCNPERCGRMCSYLDRGLKNEDRQQTNKTRHTNYVMGWRGFGLLEMGSEWYTLKHCRKKERVISPVATACAELWTAFTGHPVCQRNAWRAKWPRLWRKVFLNLNSGWMGGCVVWGFTVVTGSTLIILWFSQSMAL